MTDITASVAECPFTSAVAGIVVLDGILRLTINAPPVNAIGQNVRQAIRDAVAIADQTPDLKAMIIRCDGKTFFAGADISEFGKSVGPPSLPDVVNAVENARVPIIAEIHGTALGGGLEVALACHFRIAAQSAKLGFPEVKLGLLPGAGGTQRLPRLLGIELALEMMTGGTPINATFALQHGLIDEIASDQDLQAAALNLARRAADRLLVKTRTCDRAATLAHGQNKRTFFDEFLMRNAKRFRQLDAPKAIVDAMRFGIDASFEEAVGHERSLFLELQNGSQSKALRHIFFAEREATKIPGLSGSTPAFSIEKIGIVGAGTMGTGIAINFLLAGMPVTLVEANDAVLARGRSMITKAIMRGVDSKRLSAVAAENALRNLRTSLEYASLTTADLIIEAAFETMDAKQQIFANLDKIAKPKAILATNTSYLDVDQIAMSTSRPAQVLGMHFFSPANVMKLLEVVRAEKTSDEVLSTALAVAKKVNKIAVVAGVTEGFIGNRMLAVRRSIAEELLLQGARPASIDGVLEAFGMPMGPFRMADLAGLDLGWNRETSRGATIRERLCERDRRGQKSGAGFYDYNSAGQATESPIVEEIIKLYAAERRTPQRIFSDHELLVRLVYPMINEGAKILEDGKSFRASDIDVVWVYGYGWPAWRGGPMFYASTIGLNMVEAELDALSSEIGKRHTPCALLRKLAAENSSFAAFDEKNRSARKDH